MWLLLIVLAILVTGCDLPRDPQGTLERVQGGMVRIGIADNPPWVRFEDGQAAGVEAELLRAFSRELDARIEWVPGTEAKLFEGLAQWKLDVVIAGLKQTTPWESEIGLTRPYVEWHGEPHVMAVPPGENAWLVRLEKFLHKRRDKVHAMLQDASR